MAREPCVCTGAVVACRRDRVHAVRRALRSSIAPPACRGPRGASGIVGRARGATREPHRRTSAATRRSADGRRPLRDARDRSGGFSITLQVQDDRGREWNVKIGPEAQTEVAARASSGRSAITSCRRISSSAGSPSRSGKRAAARRRPVPAARAGDLEVEGHLVVARQSVSSGRVRSRACSSLMMVLEQHRPEGPATTSCTRSPASRAKARARWYVVKDLGASLGETGRHGPAPRLHRGVRARAVHRPA